MFFSWFCKQSAPSDSDDATPKTRGAVLVTTRNGDVMLHTRRGLAPRLTGRIPSPITSVGIMLNGAAIVAELADPLPVEPGQTISVRWILDLGDSS